MLLRPGPHWRGPRLPGVGKIRCVVYRHARDPTGGARCAARIDDRRPPCERSEAVQLTLSRSAWPLGARLRSIVMPRSELRLTGLLGRNIVSRRYRPHVWSTRPACAGSSTTRPVRTKAPVLEDFLDQQTRALCPATRTLCRADAGTRATSPVRVGLYFPVALGVARMGARRCRRQSEPPTLEPAPA
jgi:hypothetical protein